MMGNPDVKSGPILRNLEIGYSLLDIGYSILLLPSVLLHISCNVSFLLILHQLIPFIVLAFTPCQCQLDLCQPPAVEIYPKRDKGETPLRKFYFDLGDLLFVQKQLAVPFRFVIGSGGLWVWGYLAADEPTPVAFDPRKRTVEVRLSVAQGFHLAADENQAGLELFDEFIIVIGLFVLNVNPGLIAGF